MSRMHNSKRGKAGSHKSRYTVNPAWVKMGNEEIEKYITEEYKKGNTPSKIGTILRDQYGVPSVKLATGNSIKLILKKNNIRIDIPEDLANLIAKHKSLASHLRKHKYDKSNKRGFDLINSKIRRLVKYYKRLEIIDSKWVYTPPVI